MRKLTKSILVAGAATLLSSASSAAEINWSGFMSVVGGQVLDTTISNPLSLPIDESEFETFDVGYLGYESTYTTDFKFEPESMIGIQGQAVITDQLRSTIQIVARGGDEWNAYTEWAFLTYSLNEQWEINAGRFRSPLYYYSEFLDVGFTYEVIRPSNLIYTGPSGINGLNASYSSFWGDIEVASQLYLGNTSGDSSIGRFDVQDILGINLSMTLGDATVRFVREQNEISFGIGSPLEATADLEFISAAFIYNYENFKLTSEAVGVTFGEADMRNAFSVTLAYSIGDFTPNYTYGYYDETPETFQYETAQHQIGVAWNFHPGAILKLGYTIANYEPYTRETLNGLEPVIGPFPFDSSAFPYAEQKKLITASIDIVF